MQASARNVVLHLVAVLALGSPAASFAAPSLVQVKITENANRKDVDTRFRIEDLSQNAANSLPLSFEVTLCEDDVFSDDLLGTVTVTVPTVSNGSTQTGSNGYLSPTFTPTYFNSTNDVTGKGDDYYLTLNKADCPNRGHE